MDFLAENSKILKRMENPPKKHVEDFQDFLGPQIKSSKLWTEVAEMTAVFLCNSCPKSLCFLVE